MKKTKTKPDPWASRTCKICGKKKNYKSDLEKHITSQHTPPAPNPPPAMPAATTNQSSTMQYSMQQHIADLEELLKCRTTERNERLVKAICILTGGSY